MIYMSFNPPRNPYEWVNEYVDSKRSDDDYLIHHTTYLDDEKGFLLSKSLRKLRSTKR